MRCLFICCVLVGSACGSTTVEPETAVQTEPTGTSSSTAANEAATSTSVLATDEPIEEAIAFESRPDAKFETLFDAVPAEGISFEVTMSKPHAAAFDQQLSAPVVATKESTRAYVKALAAAAADTPRGSNLGGILGALDVDDVEDWEAAYGFTVNDVVTQLRFFTDQGTVWVGMVDVEAETIIEAVGSEAFWSAHLQESEHAGLSYFRWDTGRRQNIDGVSQPRPEGIGGQLALIDGLVIRTTEEQDMHDTLATLAGEADALSDDPAVRHALQRVDSLGLTTAYMAWPEPLETILFGHDSLTVESVVAERPLLGPYTAAIAGHNLTTDAIVLIHDDALSTAENEQALVKVVSEVEPWNELLSLTSITADERVVAAQFDRDSQVVVSSLPTRKPLYWARPSD